MDKPANGTAYIPGSGFEGAAFIDAICCNCTKMGPEDETGCRILAASFCGTVDEWYRLGDVVLCTNFEALPTLGIDGEPLTPEDPRQLRIEVFA